MDNLKNSVYLLTENNEEYKLLLADKQVEAVLTENKDEATILLADPPLAALHLDEFPNLQWVQSTFAGVDALMKPTLRQDYLLTNIKGIFGQLISEYVLGHLLSYSRHFGIYRQQQANHCWVPHSYQTVAGKMMLILGTGAIGSYLAEVASGFGIEVVGLNRTGIPPKSKAFSRIFHSSELHSAFEMADIIVNTLPNTPETTGLLDLSSLSHCSEALLFNVGRGQTVNDAELLTAIDLDYIQHAFLDVFNQEPLPEDHPYWDSDKVTITPHIAALSFPEQVIDIFVDNLENWSSDDLLVNQVDFSKGY